MGRTFGMHIAALRRRTELSKEEEQQGLEASIGYLPLSNLIFALHAAVSRKLEMQSTLHIRWDHIKPLKNLVGQIEGRLILKHECMPWECNCRL